MTNADKFKGIFGMYATELWAKPEKEFLEWLNADVPNLDDGGTISRQAAIEALDGEITVTGRANAEAVRGYANLVCDRIKRLPSAQPERTCVNCGRTANNGGWYADGRTRCPIEEHYALPKDGYCHLWEKRNVTDDDYPERRTDG